MCACTVLRQDGLEEVRRARMANLQVWTVALELELQLGMCSGRVVPAPNRGRVNRQESTAREKEMAAILEENVQRTVGGRAFGERPGSLKAAEKNIKYRSGSPPIQVLHCSFMSWIEPNPTDPCVDMCKSR